MQIVKFGRANHNNVVINNNFVSNDHCEIVLYDNGAFVLNDYSTNGTYVNGHLVQKRSCNLNSEDAVFIGGVQVFWRQYFDLTAIKNNNYDDEDYDDYDDYDDHDEVAPSTSSRRSRAHSSNHISEDIHITNTYSEVNKRGDDFSKKFFENMGDTMGNSIGTTVGCLVSIVIVIIFFAIIFSIAG